MSKRPGTLLWVAMHKLYYNMYSYVERKTKQKNCMSKVLGALLSQRIMFRGHKVVTNSRGTVRSACAFGIVSSVAEMH